MRYVDFKWHVIEYFLGIVHVSDTIAAIEALFSKHNLDMSRICRQSYDGASNMQSEFNGQKNFGHEYEYIHSLCLLFCALTSIDTFSRDKEPYSNCMYR